MFDLDAHQESGRAKSPRHRKLVIVSDLHISNGKLEDFDHELEDQFLRFLEWLGSCSEPTELVINGDFLDFVQASPWSGRDLEGTTGKIPLCFDQKQSFEKFVAINGEHARTFDALKALLACNRENRLVILPGNHDPDFFWPLVQREFAKLVCPIDTRGTQLSFHLSGAYQPYPWLWIEHGHQYDPVNSFQIDGRECWSAEYPPIFATTHGAKRLYECTGTRFLIRFLNGLDARYPFVDNVKPFSRFVKIFGMSALIPGWGPLDAAIVMSQILNFFVRTSTGRPHDLLSITGDDGTSLPHPLRVWIEEASDTERQKLSTRLRDRGFELNLPLDMTLERPAEAARLIEFLSEHLDIVADLGERPAGMLGADHGTLTLRTGFNANESEDLYAGAARLARQENVTTVVMGHTHEAMERRNEFTYFNTGSWTRYYRFQQDESTRSWSILREKSYVNFPYRLLYVLVQPGESSAAIKTWQERSK